MAAVKNSSRRKRKYANQASTTEKNKKKKQQLALARQARLLARTQSLIGQHVSVRVKGNLKPMVGTVLEVVDRNHESYPHDARRHVGRYLRVRTTIGEILTSRHRSKLIKD